MVASSATKARVFIESETETSGEDPLELGAELERVCFLEPVLERSYRRVLGESTGRPLGLTWDGSIEFVLTFGKQLVALRNALYTAFGGRRVRIKLSVGTTVAELDLQNVDLKGVEEFLQKVVPNLK
jgi:hypothetical protein